MMVFMVKWLLIHYKIKTDYIENEIQGMIDQLAVKRQRVGNNYRFQLGNK